jgi:methylated-DNA-[protein]-cysteine S-methyltransferase
LPLDPRGTAFQQSVWAALLTIPFGETRSYGAIARQVGRPTAYRAVGAANSRNPISIIMACHRVIGSGGALTGFAGGLKAKEWLLKHEEGARLKQLVLPRRREPRAASDELYHSGLPPPREHGMGRG